MGEAKKRQGERQRLHETTRSAARVLDAALPVAAQALLLVVVVNAPRRSRYDILDYAALQRTADALAARVRRELPDERFCLVAYPALYPLFGLYDAVHGASAFEIRAEQAVLVAGCDLDGQAWCMDRAVVPELVQAVPDLEEGDADFEAAVFCYLPVVVVGEQPLSDALLQVRIEPGAAVQSGLGALGDSQGLEVKSVGLVANQLAQPVYDQLATEALATWIAMGAEVRPRFHFIAGHSVLSAGSAVWLGQPAFADLANAAQDELDATQWLVEQQRFHAQLRRRLVEHGLTVRTALFDGEGDDALAGQTLERLRLGELASGEDFVIEPIDVQEPEGVDPEGIQLTEYVYEDHMVLGVLSTTHGSELASQSNLYPCSSAGPQAIVAYAEEVAKAAGLPLERIRHDGAVLTCSHCGQPVPLTEADEGEEQAQPQPLAHRLH